MDGTTMKAAVLHAPGPPSALKLEQIPIPDPSTSQVLIRVKAFGLNRSELFTRQGHSPGIKSPRVLGIEAVGTVEKCPGKQLVEGVKVATVMGGMGREFDGGYAEFVCVPVANVMVLDVGLTLGWEVIGAVPEMLQTAWGSLFTSLRLKSEDRLLVRGGTTSVGLAAAGIARNIGCFVAGTTRDGGEATAEVMRKSGVQQVIVDDGNVAEQVKHEKFDKVLELVGITTLADSLQCAAPQGIVCMSGIVGNKWTMDSFSPMETIPHSVCLTVYSGGPDDFHRTPLNDLLQQIEAGTLHAGIGKVFHLDQIVEAHDTMERNLARGKIVVLTE